MYFAIGGRRTHSGLYRVTYTGAESTEPSRGRGCRRRGPRPAPIAGSLPRPRGPEGHRRRLAAPRPSRPLHPLCRPRGDRIPGPEDLAGPRPGRDGPPGARSRRSLALARAGDKALQPKLLDALGRLEWDGLDVAQKLEALRVLRARDHPDGQARLRDDRQDRRQSRRALPRPGTRAERRALQAPRSPWRPRAPSPKTMALLAKAPTQEEQIEYVAALRNVRTGWTPELRQAYFSWFLKRGRLQGRGEPRRLHPPDEERRRATLTAEEKVALKPILEANPAETVLADRGPGPRPVVKEWKVEELAPVVEAGLERVATSTAAATCSPRPIASPATATTTRAAASAPTSPALPAGSAPRPARVDHRCRARRSATSTPPSPSPPPTAA